MASGDTGESSLASASIAHLNLLHSQKNCDVTFILGVNFQSRMSCHSLFLRARSPVFDVMFSQRWTPTNGIYEIQLPDVTLKPFRTFLEFVYADKWVTTPETSLEEVVEVFKIAYKYDLTPLTRKCEDFIKTKITLNNVIRIYERVACLYESTQLKEATLDFMTKNFYELERHPSFLLVTEYTLLQFLGRDDLPVYELNLFQAMVKWANFILRTRSSPATSEPVGLQQRGVLQNILPLIRFPLLRPDEFTNSVVPTGILLNDEVIALYMFFNDDPKTRTASIKRVISFGFSTNLRSSSPSSRNMNRNSMSAYPRCQHQIQNPHLVGHDPEACERARIEAIEKRTLRQYRKTQAERLRQQQQQFQSGNANASRDDVQQMSGSRPRGITYRVINIVLPQKFKY